MTCKERLVAYLREQQAPFAVHQHHVAYTAQGVAAAERIPNQMMAKVVVVSADGALIMLVLPTSHRVNMAKVVAALGARELFLVDERELAAAFPDCEVGAMPPFGNLYNIPVYVDQQLTEDETIVFQAGTHSETIHMPYADYARLVGPTVIDFARHRRQLRPADAQGEELELGDEPRWLFS
jgi:Ala-tRNA(Pro) deacylase